MEISLKKNINLDYLKQLSNGSNEFITQMITVFLEQTPEALNNLEKQLNSKDWKSLRATAHKMKPSFSFMGIKELESVIKSVEEFAANEVNLELLPEMVAKLKSVCSSAIEELKTEKQNYQ